MSKHESASWFAFAAITGATAWLAVALWASWPETATFAARVDGIGRMVFWAVVLASLAVHYGLPRWRAKDLAADERERAIADAGNAQGFAALALMLVVMGIVLRAQGGVPDGLDRDWVRFFLLLPIGIAFSITFGYRVLRYRFG